MSETKIKIFLVIFFSSIALIGLLNISKIFIEQIPFYKSATIQSVKIDSISFVSSDPAYGIYGIIGYGILDSNKEYISVDMTDGVNINSFSMGETFAFKGQIFEVFVNANFEQARLKIREKSEIESLNKRNLLLYSICLFPLIALIIFWIVKRKSNNF